MPSSEFDREVEYLIKPIQDAGYTSLPYDKTMESLEDQLRSRLKDAIVKLLEGGPSTSNFSIGLKTIVRDKPVQFLFKVMCDTQSRQPIFLSGMEVKAGRAREYHLFEPSRTFPSPVEAFDSLRRVQLKQKKDARVIKKNSNRGKKL